MSTTEERAAWARPGLPAMAERLRIARARSGATQEQVAARIGLTRVTITNLESGRFDLSLRTLLDLCDLYQVSTDWLLAREPLTPKEIELGALYEERERLKAVVRRAAGLLRNALAGAEGGGQRTQILIEEKAEADEPEMGAGAEGEG